MKRRILVIKKNYGYRIVTTAKNILFGETITTAAWIRYDNLMREYKLHESWIRGIPEDVLQKALGIIKKLNKELQEEQ